MTVNPASPTTPNRPSSDSSVPAASGHGLAVATPVTLSAAHRDWMMLQAYLHLEQRKTVSACQLLRLLFRQFPDDVEVQRCLALGELMSQRPVEAARVATRALQKGTDKLRMPVGLVFAKALWDQGKHEAAREFLASLLTNPNRPL